jgi:hypothetical protein
LNIISFSSSRLNDPEKKPIALFWMPDDAWVIIAPLMLAQRLIVMARGH